MRLHLGRGARDMISVYKVANRADEREGNTRPITRTRDPDIQARESRT